MRGKFSATVNLISIKAHYLELLKSDSIFVFVSNNKGSSFFDSQCISTIQSAYSAGAMSVMTVRSVNWLCRSGTSLAATDTLFTSCTSESLLLVPVVSAAVPQSCLPHRSDNTCTVLCFTSCRLYGTLVQICRTLQQLMLNTIKYLWDCSVAYLSNYTVFQKKFISRTFMTTVWNSNQFK